MARRVLRMKQPAKRKRFHWVPYSLRVSESSAEPLCFGSFVTFVPAARCDAKSLGKLVSLFEESKQKEFTGYHTLWPLFITFVRVADYAALTLRSGCARVRCKVQDKPDSSFEKVFAVCAVCMRAGHQEVGQA